MPKESWDELFQAADKAKNIGRLGEKVVASFGGKGDFFVWEEGGGCKFVVYSVYMAQFRCVYIFIFRRIYIYF